MANFRDILNRIIDILDNESGVFLGIEHDDMHFNPYFEYILPELMNRYNNIHFLLEFPDNLLQQQLAIFHHSVGSAARNVPASDVKLWCENFLQNGGQPGIFPAVWASHSKLEVRGVDTAGGRGINQLHNSSVPIAAKIPILVDRALNTGEDMAQNARAYLGTITPTAKHLIIGGCMHTEVAKKLNIKSINIITTSQLQYLSFMVKTYQPLQSPSFSLDKIPDYVFYYQAPAAGHIGNLDQIPVKTDSSALNSLSELPACAISYEILDDIKSSSSSHSIVNKFTDELIRKYNINVSPNSSAHWGKLLRMAVVNDRLFDVRHCIEVLKIDINGVDQTPNSTRTALHWAAIKQHLSIARYLLLHGANANLPDTTPQKKTATDYVRDTKNNDLFAAFSLIPPPLVNNQSVSLP